MEFENLEEYMSIGKTDEYNVLYRINRDIKKAIESGPRWYVLDLGLKLKYGLVSCS